MTPGKAALLRLYMNADNRFGGKPLYEAVVIRAREMGLAGASVFTAEMGFGSHQVIHDSMSEYSFVALPVVVEVVDVPERIESLLAELKVMVREGLATVSTMNTVNVARDVHSPE